MATKEQVEMMLKRLKKANPDEFFKCINETQVGIGAVLRLLFITDGTVTAGKISEDLHISTARVAVLLKKMVAKGLIKKERDSVDARITVVKLTELGEQTVNEMRDELYRQAGHIIDTVGEERLVEFINIASEIKDAVKPSKFNFIDEE